jgi:Bacterial Ig-like domain (group 3)/Putative Ig domain
LPTFITSAASYTVTVTDANNATATAAFSLAVNGPVTASTATASKVLTQNQPSASFTPVTVGGGTTPLSYSVSPNLPAGLSINATTGAVSGSPTGGSAATSYTVTVTDANGATANASFSLTVNSVVVAQQAVASVTLTANHTTAPFTPVAGSGGTGPLMYSVSPGLPNGLNFSTTTGTISGTPSVADATGTYTVTVRDSNGATATASFSLAVDSAVTATTSVSATTLTVFQVATASTPVIGSGGDMPLKYSVSPGLPIGLSMASVTGEVTGTPTVVSAAMTYTVAITDANNAVATASFSLAVAKQSTRTVVSASAPAVSPVQAVTLSAMVAATVAGTPATPTGTVIFLDNGVQLGGAVNVVNGTAQLVVPSLPAGATAVITATYQGDGNFLGSTSSNSASVLVGALDFTFTNTGTSAYTAAPGAVASYSFALAPLYGSYAGPVSFSVTGLPTGATANVMPSTIAVNGGTTSVVMTVQTASATAHNRSGPFGRGIVLALLFLPLMAKRRVREKLNGRMLLLVLLMAGLTTTLTGCGSTSGFLLQRPQTYTLTVTATGGTLQHSQAVTLIVQ